MLDLLHRLAREALGDQLLDRHLALDETVVLGRDDKGVLAKRAIALPDSVKPKRYRQEFRTRFCEGLLARRILVAEGATEAAA